MNLCQPEGFFWFCLLSSSGTEANLLSENITQNDSTIYKNDTRGKNQNTKLKTSVLHEFSANHLFFQ